MAQQHMSVKVALIPVHHWMLLSVPQIQHVLCEQIINVRLMSVNENLVKISERMYVNLMVPVIEKER